MGHFSHNCKLTNLPITGGTPVALFPMVMRKSLYDNSEEHLRKYGSTYMCSNDGARLKYVPCMFPILGEYDDYGGIENIIEDENTKAIEVYYGLTIQEVCNIITCGRKDDGYSDGLNIIKDQNQKDKYGEPKYLPKYESLVQISGMWIHGDVYRELTNEPTGGWYDKLDLGTNGILESVGFTKLKEPSKDSRYTIQYEKDGLIINSDGTWINVPKESIFSLKDLKKYCEKNGVSIDIEETNKKDKMEQMFDYVLPKCINKFRPLAKDLTDDEIDEILSDDDNGLTKSLVSLLREKGPIDKDLLADVLDNRRLNRQSQQIAYYFLNLEYDGYKISNPITNLYLQKASQGQLRENLVKFWRFDGYMYDCGRFYDVVGTGPQDGERKSVMKVLNVATTILQKSIEEFYEDDYDEDEE